MLKTTPASLPQSVEDNSLVEGELMTLIKQIALAGLCALAVLSAGSTANATPTVNGGPVNAAKFNADRITSGIFNYVGNSTNVFTADGTGTLTIAESSYADTFGYAKTITYSDKTVVFADAAQAGAAATIAPTYSPFVFFFATGGSGGNGQGADSAATLYSDGHTSGTNGGGQATLAIYKSTTGEYAFFFDDGGPSGCSTSEDRCVPNDDNDYNDMVVTYQVPEPASLALLGLGMIGMGVISRRRSSASAAC